MAQWLAFGTSCLFYRVRGSEPRAKPLMFKTLSTMDDGRKNRGMWAVRTRRRGRASGKAGRSEGEGERYRKRVLRTWHAAFRTSFFLSLRTRKIFFAFELTPRVLPFSLLFSPSKVPSLRIMVEFSLIYLIRKIVILSETNSRVVEIFND